MSTAMGQSRLGRRRDRRQGDHVRDRQARQAGGRRGRRCARATRWCSRPPSGRPEAREGADFFPLTVDVEERTYAAGKIPGGFFKREGRATERATLTARMIDRPIRPLWPKGFRNEVQVHLHRALGRPGHAARHPLHQRRVGGADDLAAAVLRPGRRRAHRPDRRRARRQPDACRRTRGVDARPDRRRHEGRPDDGRGRRRRGARGRRSSRRSTSRTREIRKLCEAQEDLRRQAGKPKWLDPELTAELESSHGHTIWERIQAKGLREGGAVIEELEDELAPELSMDSTEEDINRRMQVRAEPRGAAREAAARGRRGARCASSSRTTCAPSPRRSRTRRS